VFAGERDQAAHDQAKAMIDAGVQRLRPVMITVAATVTALSRWPRTAALCGSPSATRRLAGYIAMFITFFLGAGALQRVCARPKDH
jgi:multidrug efflux pump subunit AcrB